MLLKMARGPHRAVLSLHKTMLQIGRNLLNLLHWALVIPMITQHAVLTYLLTYLRSCTLLEKLPIV
jgi:hypothetical protein